jgi:hypothetical protein
MFEAGAAVRAAFFGNVSEARQNAKAALKLSRSRDVEYGAAFALAVSGDNLGSEHLVKDMQKRPGGYVRQIHLHHRTRYDGHRGYR